MRAAILLGSSTQDACDRLLRLLPNARHVLLGKADMRSTLRQLADRGLPFGTFLVFTDVVDPSDAAHLGWWLEGDDLVVDLRGDAPGFLLPDVVGDSDDLLDDVAAFAVGRASKAEVRSRHPMPCDPGARVRDPLVLPAQWSLFRHGRRPLQDRTI